MYYEDTGSGTPMVLLHAFPLDSRMWDGVRAPLAERLRVITPDQRGLGRSPLADGAADLALVAADVVHLLDELGLDRVVLGGLSMGGYVAMAVLASAPERVAGLALIDTRPSADAPPSAAKRLAMAARAETEGGTDWLADDVLPGLIGATTAARRPEVVATLRELVAAQPAEGVAWAQRAMANRPDSSDVLRAVAVPALVVHGAEDALIPPTEAAAMARLLPRGELVTLPSAGHLPAIETPAELAGVLLRWLAAARFA